MLQEGAIPTFEAYQECRIRKVEAMRDDTSTYGLCPIRPDDRVCSCTSCRLVFALENTWTIVSHGHDKPREWFKVFPVLTINTYRGSKQPHYARLARFLTGVALIKPTCGAPRLHWPD